MPAACGTFGVREDRTSRSGRTISLRLVVLKAKHPSGRAIAFVPGGPGQSAVSLAPLVADRVFAKELSVLRDRYDILFADSRGMGGPDGFTCDLAPPAHPGDYFRQLWPDERVSACRAQSAARSNLNLYNTNHAVDDLDAIRAALGYPMLVLDGGSYGTFFSFVFLRRHPQHVESAVLSGVYAPHFQPLPGDPVGAQTALDDLVAKCRRDAVCRTHFPRFAQHFDVLVRRFDRGPLSVKVKNLESKRYETVLLSKEVFVDQFRQMLDQPENAATLPYVVERAYRRDYVPLGELVQAVSQGLAHGINWGAFLSYTCAEEIPFLSEAELKAAAARSFAGNLRARAQQRACSIWNVRAMPPSFNEPVRSDVPVLMVSGSDDPATPARYAAQELPYLPNAKRVLVRGAGHTTETPCTTRLIVEFVRTRSAKRLDTSQCSAVFVPPHFATTW